MVTDPVSDLIIRIKNGSDAGLGVVAVTKSKLIENIAHALKKAGFVSSVEKGKNDRELALGIIYFDGAPRIHGVERISKPSRRIYQKSRDIRGYKSGFGNVILSTPKGIFTDVEARKMKVGGEVLFRIW
ncbi:30S ribosomal protein S8 [Patescibacteria group bacterium]|nr:30S ribosomal protein S8 [Patescibacteria group bacterium]MDE1946880.1 30S ribosomal protein S8 [Patescibacteria group bacterium]MDE2010700.1 30S ribosomal protein S8 [Patescibacteria group bacterium]MDE2232694.1 30S ribosomal protein S8 [Patescibacteria group bacterium]